MSLPITGVLDEDNVDVRERVLAAEMVDHRLLAAAERTFRRGRENAQPSQCGFCQVPSK